MFAQDMEFWTTTVPIEKSTTDIQKMLKKHEAKNCGAMFDDDELMLIIVFTWLEKKYEMHFRPIKPQYTRGYKSRKSLDEQSTRQMGRVALNYIKCTLQLAMNEKNAAMMIAYQKLPNGPTLQQLGADGVMKLLQDVSEGRLALPAPGGTDV